MRIAFITTSLDPAGAETSLAALVLGLADFGAEPVVVALRGSGRLVHRLRSSGIVVDTLDAQGATAVALQVPAIVKRLRAFKPDVIQGWMYHGNLLATILAPASSARLFWGVRQALGATERESKTTNRIIRLCAWLSRRPAAIVYNSERGRSDHETIGYARDWAHVIPNGFDTDALRPDTTIRDRVRQALRVSHDQILVGHLARYHPVKDHRTFLAAAAQVKSHASQFRFVMAGRGIDAANAHLRATLAEYGLTEQVSLLGEVEDVSTLLPALDVLCLSSRSEAFPNVLGEAMSCAVLCVTTDVGDAAAIVGDCGWVVQPGHAGEMRAALMAAAALQLDERRARGQAARERIVARYSLASTRQRYADLYGLDEARR
jgi:glycosyltransferase involved in cell wall biosynthesis